MLKGQPTKSQLQEALKHRWLTGTTASDHNLLPEIRAYVAKARLRRGIELVKLANRIEHLKMQEDNEEDTPGDSDVPAGANEAVGETLAAGHFDQKGLSPSEEPGQGQRQKKKLSDIAKGAIFREIVLAKVRQVKEQEAQKRFEEEVAAKQGTAK